MSFLLEELVQGTSNYYDCSLPNVVLIFILFVAWHDEGWIFRSVGTGKKWSPRETHRGMDDSWRMRMGLMFALHRCWSIEDQSSSPTQESIFNNGVSEAKRWTSMTLPTSLEIHLGASSHTNSPGLILSESKFSSSRFCFSGSNRSLRVFRIPAKNDMFNSDIFGSDDDRRSRERSGSHSKQNRSWIHHRGWATRSWAVSGQRVSHDVLP